jgi:CheY-like chemotaxis protein
LALPAGRYVRLSVIDMGVGMDPDTLRRAIEPFFTTKGVGRGTGLGLSMVHGLAAQSGGALTLESAPERGTTATLYLPIAEGDDLDRRKDAETEPGPIRTLKILLVDDEELVRMGLNDMLEGMGHRVSDAASAAAALRHLRSEPEIELLIADYMMPSMTGVSLVREARHVRPGLPALLVTGYATIDATATGNLVRLSKPFREIELARAIAVALGEGSAVPIAT